MVMLEALRVEAEVQLETMSELEADCKGQVSTITTAKRTRRCKKDLNGHTLQTCEQGAHLL
jgi:hypothetical protein